jgi:hypothetical protein
MTSRYNFPIYGRLKHDWHLAEYDFKPRRIDGQPNPPETVPYYNAPRVSKFGWKLTPEWHKWLKAINWCGFWLRDRAYKGIITPKAGWINGGDGVDSVTFGGNVIEIIGESDYYWRVRALAHDVPPGVNVNHKNFPEFVHKFIAVRRKGGLMRGGRGLYDQYISLVKIVDRDAWFPKSRVELFPLLDQFVTADKYDVKIHVNSDKDSDVVGYLRQGISTFVEQYRVRGGDVWGRCSGWIMLQEQYKPAVINYHTNWKMRTVPPL